MSSCARAIELRRNLRRSLIDGSCFSVMVGAGETYLAAFVLALDMGEVAAGLVASVPMLAGGVIQMVSPAMVRLMGSHRRWVVMCAALQALAFAPLAIGAVRGGMSETLVFLAAALYWGSGMATGPAWNTWIGTLVPKAIRSNYFARRSRWAHLAVLCGVVGGGAALQIGANQGRALSAFALLFLVSGACRAVSTMFLSRQTEPEKPDEDHRRVSLGEMLRRLPRHHDGRLLLYMLAVQGSIQISGPYFTPYMLGNLKLSYAHYLMLIATAYSARILMLPMLGGLVEQVGGKRVLRFCGFAMIPLAAMWLVSDNLIWLFFVQLTAGAVWAAYELATFLLLFETIREEERTSILTTYNLGYAIATVGGSALGAWLLHRLGTGHEAYMAVFGLSSIARLGTLALLFGAVRGVPARAMPARPVPVPTRIVAVRPNEGSVDRPILPGLPEAGMAEEPQEAMR